MHVLSLEFGVLVGAPTYFVKVVHPFLTKFDAGLIADCLKHCLLSRSRHARHSGAAAHLIYKRLCIPFPSQMDKSLSPLEKNLGEAHERPVITAALTPLSTSGEGIVKNIIFFPNIEQRVPVAHVEIGLRLGVILHGNRPTEDFLQNFLRLAIRRVGVEPLIWGYDSLLKARVAVFVGFADACLVAGVEIVFVPILLSDALDALFLAGTKFRIDKFL